MRQNQRAEHRAAQRERIVRAALEAFLADPDATLADVARVAGMAKGNAYCYFPTKAALVAAVLGRAAAELEARRGSEGSAPYAVLVIELLLRADRGRVLERLGGPPGVTLAWIEALASTLAED